MKNTLKLFTTLYDNLNANPAFKTDTIVHLHPHSKLPKTGKQRSETDTRSFNGVAFEGNNRTLGCFTFEIDSTGKRGVLTFAENQKAMEKGDSISFYLRVKEDAYYRQTERRIYTEAKARYKFVVANFYPECLDGAGCVEGDIFDFSVYFCR